MKRYLISTVAILIVITVALVAFGQDREQWRQRMAQYRERQNKAIEAIGQQVAKLKAGMEAPMPRTEGGFQDMTEEERANFRERFMKMREERQQALAAIEQHIMVLKGRRQLDREQEESIAELQSIQALAASEKAEKTAKRLEELIAKRNKEYEDTMQKLGLERFGRRQ